MAHCEAPSFSLGLDFTLDSCSPPHSPINPPPNHDDLDLAQQRAPDSDSDPPQRIILKRLRRGPAEPQSPPPQQSPALVGNDDDEDIEEFSSQDHHDEDDLVQVHPHSSSTWSSSKVSLKGCGALTPLSSRVTKRKQPCSDDAPVSAKMETGKSGLVFPKLTTSSLLRFQLIDSDSDDDALLDEDVVVAADSDKIAECNRSNNAAPSLQNLMKTKLGVEPDLWKDFDISQVKRFSSVPTPAFNEVCEEYFLSAKNNEAEKSGSDVAGSCGERRAGFGCQQGDHQQVWESAGPVPPSHRYFFHEDPRIQQLVRGRLCNFSPLGTSRVNQHPNASDIDYMGQFGNGGPSGQKSSGKSSAKGNNRSRNLTIEESFNASGGWVDPKGISQFSNGESSRKKTTKRNSSNNSGSRGKNKMNESSTPNVLSTSAHWVEPKSCTSTPKNAGKQRVQASGESSGHWFTSSDGRKVYVNKSGQELTGRIAYRQYRKETGTGFKKSRKKTGAKKRQITPRRKTKYLMARGLLHTHSSHHVNYS